MTHRQTSRFSFAAPMGNKNIIEVFVTNTQIGNR